MFSDERQHSVIENILGDCGAQRLTVIARASKMNASEDASVLYLSGCGREVREGTYHAGHAIEENSERAGKQAGELEVERSAEAVAEIGRKWEMSAPSPNCVPELCPS